ncbi:related to Protein yippee-like MOH1 [Nakaseomyces glabratus]|nr:Yippee domain profile [Nakaseomyces glabratus]QNG13510.1 uncharacterized protein GWK60_F04235 [Nakaseomyces glabratus]SCV14257.1 related to Protein yippee-like MOH1 [Nakaseomyces glabratus]SLM12847.1 related to Protein yippee-like MOH1 [Nakaseomyces glabratus]
MGLRYTSYIESPLANDLNKSFKGSRNSQTDLYQYNEYGTIGNSLYSGPILLRQRRRTLSGSSDSSSSSQEKIFVTYGCRRCRTHLSSSSHVISKDYRGKTGTAYLMDEVLNVLEGNVETRPMLTGDYVVCDILCHWCKNVVGWKYLQSERKDQRYKEGKFILEVKTICKCD